jgi:hypothetical protein
MDIGLFNNIGRARVASRQGAKFAEQLYVFHDPQGMCDRGCGTVYGKNAHQEGQTAMSGGRPSGCHDAEATHFCSRGASHPNSRNFGNCEIDT